jgi:thiamine phosphate synthase YjbQ (UPF0047 family)
MSSNNNNNKGGTFCRFYKGTTGASSAHINYISRPSAVREQEQGILIRNLPEEIRDADNYQQLRNNLTTYTQIREESAQAAHKSRRQCRTHFRVIVSFERDIDTARAKEMIDEWLDKNFKDARAVAFFHRDTDHLHSHIHIDTKLDSGRKLDIPTKQYKSLRSDWDKIYSRELGREPERETARKAQASRKENLIERELKNYDSHQITTRGNQSNITASDREINRSLEARERAARAARESVTAARRTLQQAERVDRERVRDSDMRGNSFGR